MRKINKFDELPNKIKYLVGGGIKDIDKCQKRFGQMKVYECKNKDEIYLQMTKEALQPATLIDKDPLQGRSFFVALGMPYREIAHDFIIGTTSINPDTVVYFTQMTRQETLEVLKDERKARDTIRLKQKINEYKKTR